MLVIVPFYNCENWLDRSLGTLYQQRKTSEFRAVVMDDASDDGSRVKAESLCKDYDFIYQRNDYNSKCPYTIWRAMQDHADDPNEPVFILDGDDYLPDFPVIKYVEDVYKDPDIWMTYGSYRPDPADHLCNPATRYPDDVIANRSYRRSGSYFNHPLTWRTWLFNEISESDMKNRQGSWFQAGYDRIFMYPMLEMATEYDGTLHWKFLDQILYIYNGKNPISDCHAHLPDCIEADQISLYPKKEPSRGIA